MSLIEARDLRKHYFVRPAARGLARVFGGPGATLEIRAVDGISFDIAEGERVGYLGPNGAGKSTTIKVLTGILLPTSGVVAVGGIVPWRDRMRNARQIGVIFGQRTQLYWDLPLIHSFEMLRHIYGLSEPQYEATLLELRRSFALDEFLDRPVRQLSLGQRMRGDLAAAMLHRPRILYLDEPTIGLDLVAKDQMVELIRTVNREFGVTVMMATHNLSDVEQLCSRIIVINHGQIIHDGGLDAFKLRYAPFRTLLVRLARPDPTVRPLPGAEIRLLEPDLLEVRFQRGVSPHTLIRELSNAYDVKDLSVEDSSLESVLREMYKSQLGGEVAVQ